MKKILLILMLFVLGSCSQSGSATNPNNVSNNNSSVSDSSSSNIPPIFDNSTDDNDGSTGEDPNDTLTPYPAYPNDPGSSYGKVYEVVTPTIYVDDTWNNIWKVREKDYNRINYIWGQILATFERDNSGLGIVFGAGLRIPIKDHKDLAKGRPTDERLYATTWKDRNYDLKQPFHKYSQDYNTVLAHSERTFKYWKYAVLVKVSDRSGWESTSWTGKYTIGGVYRSPHRLAYVTEYNLQTAESGDDEIMIIRMDRPWDNNGIRYYRIQLLFRAGINNRVDTISQEKVYKYSDFDFGMTDRPEYSEYLWATKKINTTTLQR